MKKERKSKKDFFKYEIHKNEKDNTEIKETKISQVTNLRYLLLVQVIEVQNKNE